MGQSQAEHALFLGLLKTVYNDFSAALRRLINTLAGDATGLYQKEVMVVEALLRKLDQAVNSISATVPEAPAAPASNPKVILPPKS